jgi:hypothetical protein
VHGESSVHNKINIEGIDVYCAVNNVDECLVWGRELSHAIRVLSDIINKELKVLVVITSGMQVLMLSASEVLRKYDGIAAVDVTKPLSKNLFNSLHSISELVIRKNLGNTLRRWALEGLASALALKVLSVSNEDAFKELFESINSEKCVDLEEFFSWKFQVDVGEGFTVIGNTNENTSDVIKRFISTLTKSLEGDIIGHVEGKEKAFYSTAARLFYSLIEKHGITRTYELLTDETTLRMRIRDVYRGDI